MIPLSSPLAIASQDNPHIPIEPRRAEIKHRLANRRNADSFFCVRSSFLKPPGKLLDDSRLPS